MTIKGKIGRKIKGLSIALIPLIALFWWGTKIDPQYYKYWFAGIVLINLVFQYRHEKRRQRMHEATNKFYG